MDVTDMSVTAQALPTDKPVSLITLVGIVALSLFLQHTFNLQQAMIFLLGVGLGVSLLHASFGFSGGWRQFIRNRHSAAIRAQLWLFGLTSLLFFPVLDHVFPNLHGAPALAPVGTSVLAGAFLFGIGMQLGGGCGSGTLYTVGGGHVRMLITLSFFIVGATLGSAHLHWWLALPSFGDISIIARWGWWQALLLQIAVLATFVCHSAAGRATPLWQPNPVKCHPAAQQFYRSPVIWALAANMGNTGTGDL